MPGGEREERRRDAEQAVFEREGRKQHVAASRRASSGSTASCRRCRWPAASAPPSTSIETTSASDAATRTASARSAMIALTDSIASRTLIDGDAGKSAGDGGKHGAFRLAPGVRREAAAWRDARAARRASVFGEKTMTKLMESDSQSSWRRLAIRAVIVAAEHVHADRVADRQAEIVGDLLLERDERLAVIVGRPPIAGDDSGILRHRLRIGDAAVAAERPARSLARPVSCAAGAPFTATMRPRSIGTVSTVAAGRRLLEQPHKGVALAGPGCRGRRSRAPAR